MLAGNIHGSVPFALILSGIYAKINKRSQAENEYFDGNLVQV